MINITRGLLYRLKHMMSWKKEVQSKDHHNGLHIDMFKSGTSVKPQEFQLYLQETLKRQQQAKAKSVWVHLNKDNLPLLQTVVQNNFKIHHGIDDKIVLYRWLSTEEDLVPQFSRFIIACGGVVINQGKLLVVQEKSGFRKDNWGVPGGICQLSEPLANACTRELKQQTGLQGKYRYLLYFRELENGLYGATDLYFASYIHVQPTALNKIQICQRQLKAYQWVPLQNLKQFITKNGVFGTQRYLMQYISDLSQRKFRFDEQIPNITNEHKSNLKGVQKYFKQHRLIVP